jgi:hypothetical protein
MGQYYKPVSIEKKEHVLSPRIVQSQDLALPHDSLLNLVADLAHSRMVVLLKDLKLRLELLNSIIQSLVLPNF